MQSRDEIQFAVFPRGHIRDNIILASFRNSLRRLVNPDTGALFTEDEISRATQPGSRFYIEADADDLLCQAFQAKARWLANQMVPSRACTTMLEKVHGRQWLGADPRLPAAGGSGAVSAPATSGSIFPGSTTLGDPTAARCTDPNGAIFQNLYDATAVDGVASLTLKAITTGVATNIAANTVLTWSENQPIGATPTFTNADAFSGGSEIETDAELASRVEDIIRYRPGGGNAAHFMAWCREAHVSIEYGFVYPTFKHAGSAMVAIMQKRQAAGGIEMDGVRYAGPNARINAGLDVFNAVVQYVTPPYSPNVPEDWYIVVATPTAQPSNVVVQLSMGVGTNGGWYDRIPWPHPLDSTALPRETVITSLTDQSHFAVTVDTDDYLPGMTTDGTLTAPNAPAIMVWDNALSRFEQLQVLSMTKSGTTVSIVLAVAPDPGRITLATGMRISPYTELNETISRSAEGYFDELGPGELFDTNTDARGPRARRYPFQIEKYPARAGQLIVTRIIDALGSVVPDGQLVSISETVPDYPADVINGPKLITLGHLTIFPL